MKRSKIFLGATACVLGVAAIAASKKTVSQAFYCTQPSHAGVCKAVNVKCIYDNTPLIPTCKVNIPLAGLRTVYTTALVINGLCSPTNCAHKFTYQQMEP